MHSPFVQTDSAAPSIVFCDMDGTLVDTDRANFLAYQQAVLLVAGERIVQTGERFTGSVLRRMLPDLDAGQLDEISQLKTALYREFLGATRINTLLLHWLEQSRGQRVLVTRSRRERALCTLEHHGIHGWFDEIICYEEMPQLQARGKFSCAQQLLDLQETPVICLENEFFEVELAQKYGNELYLHRPDLAAWGAASALH